MEIYSRQLLQIHDYVMWKMTKSSVSVINVEHFKDVCF